MSEGAPLRAAAVASMAAQQQAHEVEQLRARADLAQGKSDRRFAYLMRAVGEDLATGMSPALAVAARTAGVAQEQQEWAVRVGNALLGQLSSPADQVPQQELHWPDWGKKDRDARDAALKALKRALGATEYAQFKAFIKDLKELSQKESPDPRLLRSSELELRTLFRRPEAFAILKESYKHFIPRELPALRDAIAEPEAGQPAEGVLSMLRELVS